MYVHVLNVCILFRAHHLQFG